MATWSNTNESSAPTFTNQTANTATFTDIDKNGQYEYLLQEEDSGEVDFILTEESEYILLEEINGDNLQTWSNQTEN